MRRAVCSMAAMMAVAAAPAPAPAARVLQPIDGHILFLPQAERDRRFAAMERYYAGHAVKAGGRVRRLAAGRPLDLPAATLDRFMVETHTTGVIVLQDGQVRLERYRGGGQDTRWTSFSVAKSVTSLLVGMAIRDGYIGSVDDPVTRYLPRLAGSGYDGVTIAQLLSMRSGVAWNEDYADPRADVVQLYLSQPPRCEDRTIAYMRRLPRAAPPGTRWNYATGETDLAGQLVAAATGRGLADYLSAAIWRRYGMATDAYWLADAGGAEAGGSGLSMTLRDAARLGQLVLDGGAGIVPPSWIAEATQPHSAIDSAGDGYGYFWWTYPGGRFAARGIFGQSIVIDPAHHLVIATHGDWPRATDPALTAARTRFEAAVIAAAG